MSHVAAARNLSLRDVIPVTDLGRPNTAIRVLTVVTARLGGAVLGIGSAGAGVEAALAMLLIVSAMPAASFARQTL